MQVSESFLKWAMTTSTLPILLCFAAAATLGSCKRPGDPSGPRENVIVILVDTLRADHLGVNGYDKPTSPALRAAASRGVTFSQFYSHSAITRPSVATLFSSRYPSGHGIVHQGGEALSDDVPTVAEAFNQAGYSTFAIISNPQIHADLGFSRGFNRFEMLFDKDLRPAKLKPHDLVKLPATTVLRRTREVIESSAPGPFFAYIHLIDPHGPYTPPQEFLRLFSDPSYGGKVTGSIGDFSSIQLKGSSTGADIAHFMALYDAEIAAADHAIGEFVAWMDETGLSQRTHLIIMADHGEEFMEHGRTGHSVNLFNETVRVPLIWTGPGVPQDRRVDLLAGIVDIFPTMVDLFNLPVDPESLSGISLRPAWEQQSRSAAQWRKAIFLEGPDIGSADGSSGPRAVRGVVTDSEKAIAWGCEISSPDWERLQLFDLDADPEEQRDLNLDENSSAPPERFQENVRLLETFCRRSAEHARSRAKHQIILSSEIVKQLRSLGYSDPS